MPLLPANEKEAADYIHRMAKDAQQRFEERRQYEWRICFGVWASLGAAAGLVISAKDWAPGIVEVILAVAIGLGLFVVFCLFFSGWVHAAHAYDKAVRDHWLTELEKVVGVPSPARPTKPNYHPAWQHPAALGQIFITLIFAILFAGAVLSKYLRAPQPPTALVSAGPRKAEGMAPRRFHLASFEELSPMDSRIWLQILVGVLGAIVFAFVVYLKWKPAEWRTWVILICGSIATGGVIFSLLDACFWGNGKDARVMAPFIIAVWTLGPPLYFLLEYSFDLSDKLPPAGGPISEAQKANFEVYKFAIESARHFWVAVLAVLLVAYHASSGDEEAKKLGEKLLELLGHK